VYTILIYLNDDFGGGVTNFVRDGEGDGCAIDDVEGGEGRQQDDHVTERARDVVCRVVPKTGRALIFKHETLHEGAAVEFGTKYILRTEIMFRRVPSAIDAYAYCERTHAGAETVHVNLANEKRAEVMVDRLIGQSEKLLDESDPQASFAKFAEALRIQRQTTPPFNCYTFFNCVAEGSDDATIQLNECRSTTTARAATNSNSDGGASNIRLNVSSSRSAALKEGVVSPLLLRIFACLAPSDLCRVMRVNQLYYRIGRAGSLWFAHLARADKKIARQLYADPTRDRHCVLQDWFTLYYLMQNNQLSLPPPVEATSNENRAKTNQNDEKKNTSSHASEWDWVWVDDASEFSSSSTLSSLFRQPLSNVSCFGRAFEGKEVVCVDLGSWSAKFGIVGNKDGCQTEMAAYGNYYSAYCYSMSVVFCSVLFILYYYFLLFVTTTSLIP
jgi:hypothetical protein